MRKKAVIFDLDGVIVTTDEFHYQAWQRMADEEGIYFDRKINETLRGVSRMESLAIILKHSNRRYNAAEKTALAHRKNDYYRNFLRNLTPDEMLPGVLDMMKNLKDRGIKIAIGSSSKNTPLILEIIGLKNAFDAVADGNGIKKSKPDPEIFLLAARRLGLPPEDCVVVEDAAAGIEAALAAGMKAVGVGAAAQDSRARLGANSLADLSADALIGV